MPASYQMPLIAPPTSLSYVIGRVSDTRHLIYASMARGGQRRRQSSRLQNGFIYFGPRRRELIFCVMHSAAMPLAGRQREILSGFQPGERFSGAGQPIKISILPGEANLD